jgi:hypothetical protein
MSQQRRGGKVSFPLGRAFHRAAVYDESSRRRMVEVFNQARAERKGRLVVEAGHTHHHGDAAYHAHGHGHAGDHQH